MTFICYPKCTTCQKAEKWLDANGFSHTVRHIKENNPTKDELAAWISKSGLPATKFFNTSGILYRSMDLKEKLPTMTEDEMTDLLSTDGMLVKRPILLTDDKVIVGFNEARWSEALK